MHRREILQGIVLTMATAGTVYLPAGWRPAAAANPKYRIGFSQVTTVEPWRVQFNKDIKVEAAKHSNVELLISDGQDKTEKQVADVDTFIAQQVDLILMSPKESAGLTGVVEKALDAKIPVIVLDRNVDTDRAQQWIGGDNVVIGRLRASTRSSCWAGRVPPRAKWSRSGTASRPSPTAT